MEEKLQWGVITEQLAGFCQTDEARARAQSLEPNLTPPEIATRWREVVPLVALVTRHSWPVFGEIEAIEPLLRGAELGQILAPENLQTIATLLQGAAALQSFVRGLPEPCPILNDRIAGLQLLPALARDIARTVTPKGTISDGASRELAALRGQKVRLRQQIETQLAKILEDPGVRLYLQDHFFTVRGDRYVIPLRLDGHKRVPGSVVDTSASGETLFLEPKAVAGGNAQLQDLEIAERIEILRILKALTTQVAASAAALRLDYETVIAVDALFAEARWAERLGAGPVDLTVEPTLELFGVRHPILAWEQPGATVASDIALEPQQRVLVVSGPNAGGKTVVLKTVGLLQLLARGGLLLPADPQSRMGVFPRVFVAIGDAQDLQSHLSTFSGHVRTVAGLLREATKDDLVLLDELATGTDPQTGAALAQAIVERLAASRVTSIVTTHYQSLKALALTESSVRNGAMAYRDLAPTYELLLDSPGESYGLEVAAQGGLEPAVIERAQALKGDGVDELQEAMAQLATLRERLAARERELAVERREAQAAKLRWEDERRQLRERRRKLLAELEESYRVKLDQWQKELRRARQGEREQALGDARKEIQDLAHQQRQHEVIPGAAVVAADLVVGDTVYLVGLGKQGTVIKTGEVGGQVQVDVGGLRVLAAARKLRLLGRDPQRKRGPSVTGRLDVAGLTQEVAAKKAEAFLAAAVMRGEREVVIEGDSPEVLDRLARELAKFAKSDKNGGSLERSTGGLLIRLG